MHGGSGDACPRVVMMAGNVRRGGRETLREVVVGPTAAH